MKIMKCVAAAVCVAAATATTASGQELSRVKELMTQLQAEVERLEAGQTETEEVRRDPEPVSTPEQTETEVSGPSIFPADATDPARLSQAAAREKVPIRSGCTIDELEPIDTLPSANEAVSIVLYNDNTWRYVRNKEQVKDSEIYTRYWDTTAVLPYREIALSSFPSSIVIDLVDSLQAYHYPYKGSIHPRGTFGPRRRRPHRGIDLPLKTGDPIYATFNGRVRISQYNNGGYGNLVVIRHDNGLETYYGHLSERLVTPGQWVEAGQIIGKGGSTGRSTGPHLHFETRYYGQTFDPQRLIDFQTGDLRRETIVLKRSYFDIHSNAAQDFDDEVAAEEDAKKEAAKPAATYHRIKSGDTLGGIARRYGTTVSRLCQLNGIKSTTTLRIGRSLRVR